MCRDRDDLDLLLKAEDHRPVLLDIALVQAGEDEWTSYRGRSYDLKMLQASVQQKDDNFWAVSSALGRLQPQHWKVDAHRHAAVLRQQFEEVLATYYPADRRKARQPYITAKTWMLLLNRAAWRRQINKCRIAQERSTVRDIFRA